MSESVDVRLARLEEKFDSMGSDIADIKKAIKGNGKPGLIDRVNDVEKKLAEHAGGKKMLVGILSSSAVTGLIVYLVQRLFG